MKKWTMDGILYMEYFRLHQYKVDIAISSGMSVLDAVKMVSDQYTASINPDYTGILPSELAVEEFGEPIITIRVVGRQVERLVKVVSAWNATVLHVDEVVDPSDFVNVKIAGGNLEGIITAIKQQRINITSKIRMKSKPELRIVGRTTAYGNRQRFRYQKLGLGYIQVPDKKTSKKVSIPVSNYSSEEMDEGAALRLLGTSPRRTLLHTKNGGSRYYDNGTDMLLSLELIGLTAEMEKNPTIPLADSILKHGVYIVRSHGVKNGVGIGIVTEVNGQNVVQIFSQKTEKKGPDGKPLDRWMQMSMGYVKDQIEKEQQAVKEGKVFDRQILHYESFFQSPSMTRQKTLLMVNTTDRSRDDLIKMVDQASCGAFNIMLKAYEGKDLPTEKAIKKIGRLSLMMTGSAQFGSIENFMFFFGDLSVFDSVFHDGQAFLAAEFVQRALHDLGVDVSLEECTKFINQGRFGAVKGFNVVMFRWVIQQIIRRLLEKGIAKGIMGMPKTASAALELERNSEGQFDGWIIAISEQFDKPTAFKTLDEFRAIGVLDKLDYFGDSTNVKCMFDFSQKLEYCLMDIPVNPKGHALTSRQICNIAQTNPDFLPVFVALAKATIDKILAGDISDTDLTTNDEFEYEDEGNVHQDFSKSDYATDLLERLIPGIDKMDINVRRSKYRGIINAINKVANRFNFRVKGANFKIVGDLAGWFGARLIHPGEMFANGYPTASILEAVAFRHPLCGIGEHMIVRFISKEEMLKRIETLVDEQGNPLEEDYKKALSVMIKFLAPGVCMIPSTYDYVAAYFSGADFDGDSITMIWEESVVELMKKQPQYYVLFGGHAGSDKKFRFGYDLIPESFRYQYGINGGSVNASIGMLAGFNVTVVGLLAAVLFDRISPIYVRNMFRKDKKDYVWTTIKGNYRRLHEGNVNFEGKEETFVTEFMAAVAEAGNSKQEVVDILLDLNVIISKCMNDIIDAAKTGDKVLVPFLDTMRTRIRAGSVATADYGKIELMPGSKLTLKPLQLTVKGRDGEVCEEARKKYFPDCRVCRDEEGVSIFEDTLSVLRNEILKYAYDKLSEELAVPVTSVFGAYQSQDERLHQTLVKFAEQYADLMKCKSDDKRSLKAALANMARIIMRDYSRVSIDHLIYEAWAACQYGDNESNGFYLSFVPELAKFYVEKFCPDSIFTARVYKHNGGEAELGQILDFEDGFTKDGFYAETEINGKFRLDVSKEGNAVIRKPVRDMLPKVEMNSTILLELKNRSNIKDLSYENGDVLLDIIQRARVHGGKFSVEYVNRETGQVVNTYTGANLALCINGEAVADIVTPEHGGYFTNALLHKTISVEQTEVGNRGKGKNAMKVVYVIGSLPLPKTVKRAA